MESKEKNSSKGAPDNIDFGFRKVSPDDHKTMVRDVFSSVAGRYDLMNDLMSGGLHRLWKATLLDGLRPRGTDLLLDVAGGTGDIADGFLKRGGATSVICDINSNMLVAGIDRAIDRGEVGAGPNRACADAAALPFPDGLADFCTIVFGLRNVSQRHAALEEMRRVLKPGGHFICMEFSPAVLPQLKPIYDAYSFLVLPWLGQRIAQDGESYRYLAESIRQFPKPKALRDEMSDAGFGNIKITPLTGGIVWQHSGWRI